MHLPISSNGCQLHSWSSAQWLHLECQTWLWFVRLQFVPQVHPCQLVDSMVAVQECCQWAQFDSRCSGLGGGWLGLWWITLNEGIVKWNSLSKPSKMDQNSESNKYHNDSTRKWPCFHHIDGFHCFCFEVHSFVNSVHNIDFNLHFIFRLNNNSIFYQYNMD